MAFSAEVSMWPACRRNSIAITASGLPASPIRPHLREVFMAMCCTSTLIDRNSVICPLRSTLAADTVAPIVSAFRSASAILPTTTMA